MNPNFALALMLVSAVLHALWNVGLRRQPDAPAGALVFIGGAWLLFSALALADVAAAPARALSLAAGFGLAAGLSEGAYISSLSRAMHIGPLAAVYGVSRGLPLLLLWPLSHALLGEALPLRAALAVAVLLAGLLVLTPGSDPSVTTSGRGYAWAAVTAVFNCSNSLIYKAAVMRGVPMLPLVAIAFAVAFPIGVARLAPWGRGFAAQAAQRLARAFFFAPWLAIASALAFAGSFLIAVEVLHTQGAAWVLTLRNMSIALAPLFAWAALGERPSPRAFVGVLLVFAGALSLGLA